MIAAQRTPCHWKDERGFTLIEIMIVVAIIGLMASIGVPSLITAMQKTGMRKALSEVQDVCRHLRRNLIGGKGSDLKRSRSPTHDRAGRKIRAVYR